MGPDIGTDQDKFNGTVKLILAWIKVGPDIGMDQDRFQHTVIPILARIMAGSTIWSAGYWHGHTVKLKAVWIMVPSTTTWLY